MINESVEQMLNKEIEEIKKEGKEIQRWFSGEIGILSEKYRGRQASKEAVNAFENLGDEFEILLLENISRYKVAMAKLEELKSN